MEFKTIIMIPNNPDLSGSIVLERGTHFLSKQIMMHMAIYARMTGRKPLRYSHAETLLWHSTTGILYTTGARGDGTELTWASDYYKDQDILILTPKVMLTDREQAELWHTYFDLDYSKYETTNFLAWIAWLKLPFIGWTGKKGSDRVYCYELAARFADAIGRWPKGKSLDMVSVYDLYENENYEVWKP